VLSPEAYQALLPFLDGPQIIKKLSSRQKTLAKDKLIECIHTGWFDAPYIGKTWAITDDGRDAIRLFEQRREEAAKQEAKENEDRAQRATDRKEQRRHEWRIAIFSACAASIITLLLEHYEIILVFLRELFHR